MKLILLKDDKNLGKAGSLIEAKDGYARNYLIPRKIAIEATEENMAQWKADRAEEERVEAKNRREAMEIKKKMERLKVVIEAKAGEGGRLFGAITSKDISDALKAQHNIDVDKKKIDLPENIKDAGTKKVNIKLYSQITGELKVQVKAE